MRQFEIVSQGIQHAIHNGRFGAGTTLPSERLTAQEYGVSRSTVRRAWRELEATGYLIWLEDSSPIVAHRSEWSRRVERTDVGRLASNLGPTFLGDLMQAAVSHIRYNFEIGTPDPDLLPMADFHHILGELFSSPASEVFGYSPTIGLERVRRAIAEEYLSRRGLCPPIDQILVTAGSLQGLDLLTRLWVRPGDLVVTESPTFAGALHVFRAHGARILGIPMDPFGLRTDLLESQCRSLSPRLIYVQPVAHNPTGITMAPERRQALVEWAMKTGVPIIEDDAYGFLAGPDNPSLMTVNPAAPLVHLNTFSKVLAPGIRVGCVVAPHDVIRQLASLKQLSDLHTGTLSQLVAEGWLRQGQVDRHIQRAQTLYGSRLKAATNLLVRDNTFRLFAEPRQGFYLFVRLPHGMRAQALHQPARDREVLFAVGDPFSPAQDMPDWIRLAVSARPVTQIETGLRRLLRLVHDHAEPGSCGPSEKTKSPPRS